MSRRRIAAYVTLPMLGLHLLALVAVPLMILLGMWQLESYNQRQADDVAEAAQAEPVPLDSLLRPDQAFTAEAHARPVVVVGEYAAPQLLVDRGNGTSGTDDKGETVPWLVTPLVTDTGAAILVVRGLLPTAATGATGDSDDTAESAAELPDPPPGRVRVVGSLQPSQGRVVDEDPTDAVVPALSTAQLVSEFDTDLYSGYVVLTEQEPPSDLPQAQPPRPQADFTAGLRNLMYALQWWAFAGFGVFLWWRIVREQVAPDPVA